jgi:hypothetical protein
MCFIEKIILAMLQAKRNKSDMKFNPQHYLPVPEPPVCSEIQG